MGFFSNKSFDGNFHLIFNKICKEIVWKIQSSWLFLFVKKRKFTEIKKNNYYEYFKDFLKKCEKMSLSVTAVIATGQQIPWNLNDSGGVQPK